MENKKIIIIILAGLLALLTAYFIFNTNKNKELKNTPQAEQIQQIETTQREENEVIKETQEETSTQKVAINKSATKKVEKQLIKTQKEVKNSITTEQTEQISDKIIDTKTLDTEDNGDVIVPVEFKTDSSFKYVYTPTRYKK